jgi:hypothetical protein
LGKEVLEEAGGMRAVAADGWREEEEGIFNP